MKNLKQDNTMRIFIAINWSKQTLYELKRLQKFLQEAGISGYWRPLENLHLTLKFIGEADRHQITEIHKALQEAVEGINSFDVNLKGLGVFPNIKAPKILWVGVYSKNLFHLHKAVERELYKIGINVENRKYTPHITLASGGIKNLPGLETLETGKPFDNTEKVCRIELMNSVVEDKIRVYKTLEEYYLK